MTTEARVITTDEEIDAALEAAKDLPPRPNAISAEYAQHLNVIILRLDTGRRLVIPREELQGLKDATPSQLSEIVITCGVDIVWPQLDVNHYLPHLLEGRYGSKKWMKSLEHEPIAA